MHCIALQHHDAPRSTGSHVETLMLNHMYVTPCRWVDGITHTM